MPAGPAPTMTTSYSRAFAKQITCIENRHLHAHARNITGASSRFARSDANVTSAVDDERIASHVIRAEQVKHRLRDVIGASYPTERRRPNELVCQILRPPFRQQYCSRRDGVDANLWRERVGETARHLDDARFGDCVRDIVPP